MKCAMRAAWQICFDLEILVVIVIPHIVVISKRSIVKMAVAVERLLHFQVAFCEVLLEQNEVNKNNFHFLR